MSQIDNFSEEINFFSHSEAVQSILKVLNYTTGLRISLVARLTGDSWTACAVLDEANFGLKPGDQLELQTTFWSMVGSAVAPLIINQASKEPRFANHPGLVLYGIESYIAVPLKRRDGRYFGTLCSLDPLPANLSENSLTIFTLLAKLIAFELEAEDDRLFREAEINTLNDIITIAAHDLRQPLTALQLRAYLASRHARRENVSPELETMLDNLVTDVRKASHLTDILLDVGRIESGNFVLEYSEIDLARLISTAVAEQKAATPAARFETEIPAELYIRGDETRLGQVVRNLLDNAVKYSPGSKKVVDVRLSSLPDDRVFLQVRDYGMGVEETDLKNLFKRQFRTQQAQSAGIKGSGFGLYITQKIVEAHRGQIWADLPSDGGLRFNITLPVSGLTHD